MKKTTPILLIALLALSLFGGPGYYSTRSLQALWNMGHILLFFLLIRGLIDMLPDKAKKAPAEIVLIGLGITILLSIVIEYVQYTFAGGTPDTQDVYRNFLGLFGGSVFLLKLNWRRYIDILLKLAFVALVIVELIPVGRAAIDELNAANSFPVLSDFESSLEMTRWSGGAEYSLSSAHSVSGEQSLKIRFLTTKYSGVSLNYFPRNWQGYDSLRFHLFNPDPVPLRITCRIHDRQHNNAYDDRYNQGFHLQPGWNTVAIDLEHVATAPVRRNDGPSEREMDMTQIMAVGIFTIELPVPREAYLDYIRLE